MKGDDAVDISDTLRSRVHVEWQRRLSEAFRGRGWQTPRYESSGGPVPWEELAALAVETLWSDVEPLIKPVLALVADTSPQIVASPPRPSPTQSPSSRPSEPPPARQQPWLSAEEAASLLQTTSHTLRRLAREGNCPVVVRRIGGRWRFARQDVERFIGARSADDVGARD